MINITQLGTELKELSKLYPDFNVSYSKQTGFSVELVESPEATLGKGCDERFGIAYQKALNNLKGTSVSNP